MTVYKLGSHSGEVTRIQERLKSLGFYHGPLDGDFGGGTGIAVNAFQASRGLKVDGLVGAQTWQALFNAAIETPALHNENLDHRCLALTGTFETGMGAPDCFCGISGDFDGQGLSFGVLQWNFGQGSLQPLLNDMVSRHPDLVKTIFAARFDVLQEALHSDKEELMNFVRSIQHPVDHRIFEPWKGIARTLGRTPEFQRIEVEHAQTLFQSALTLCAEFGLWSERAVALMFDIKVQNGSIGKVVKTRILQEFAALSGDLSAEELEVHKMKIVANRRAEAANPRWVDDVRKRKLCIAEGQGIVHGIAFDLAEQFGIALRKFGE